MGGGMEE